jgi:hypothetical protein
MTNSNKLAPIVLFVYNRPDHTRKTVEALSKNLLASESELFVYSDYPKDTAATDRVEEVRAYIKTIQGFKSVTIAERDKNWGLAASIIDGVTNVVNKYGKVIVLEDDIVTSPYFLTFMNDALDFYADKPEVWHVSGFTYPHIKGVKDAFFWRSMNCWGWATWKNRWCYFEKVPEKLIATFSKRDIYRFNIYGADDMWGQVLANQTGKINSWAIFWEAVIFQHNGLCLDPAVSFVRNIGLDGTGVHCGITSSYSSDVLCNKKICFNEIKIRENRKAVRAIMRFYNREHGKKNVVNRIIGKAKYIVKKSIKIILRRG